MNMSFLSKLEAIVGAEGIRKSDAEKRAYSFDAYTLEKHLPGVVALPTSTEQVSKIVALCAESDVSVVPRGAGTGLAGGSTAKSDQLLLCLSRMNRVLHVDLPNRRLRAQAGAITIQLSKATMPHGFRYAPDPSSEGACTLGGTIANNSGGPHTLKYGVTVNHVLSAQVVLSDGGIVEISQDDLGYDLLGVVVGCEGTLGIVTEATVKLVRLAEATRTMLAVCPTMDDATELITRILSAGIVPAALEIVDQTVLRAVEDAYHLGLPTDAGAVLLVELDGALAGLDRLASEVIAMCKRGGALRVDMAQTEKERTQLWMARKKSIATIGRLAPACATQDGVAPRTKLPGVLREVAEIAKKYNLRIANVFHAGDGNLHPAVLFDDRDPDEVRRVMAAGGEILKACVAAGGALTGEHGIGLEKQEFLNLVFNETDIATMMAVRGVFDPESRLNPGKLFPAGGTCCPHLPRMDNETLLGLTRTRANAV